MDQLTGDEDVRGWVYANRIAYAEKVRKENEELRKAYAAGETVMVDQTKARLESELAATKKAYKVAYEAGDSDALLAAQEKLTNLLNEQQRVAAYRPRGAEAIVPSQPQPQAQQQVQVPKPDERAMKWAESNPWFMTDKAMTGYVMGIHETLIAEGVDPRLEIRQRHGTGRG